jgi:hypothetical protein
MTAVPAKVLAVDKEGDQHRVMVRIGLAKYRGSFNTLTFGERKPRIGFCHEGQLELVYHKDPSLKTGQPFPLRRLSNRATLLASTTEIVGQRVRGRRSSTQRRPSLKGDLLQIGASAYRTSV